MEVRRGSASADANYWYSAAIIQHFWEDCKNFILLGCFFIFSLRAAFDKGEIET